MCLYIHVYVYTYVCIHMQRICHIFLDKLYTQLKIYICSLSRLIYIYSMYMYIYIYAAYVQ